MSETIEQINLGRFLRYFLLNALDNQTIESFFEDAIRSGAAVQDCNLYLSLLLERCSSENCLETMFPVISTVAQRLQELIINNMPKNHMIESIH